MIALVAAFLLATPDPVLERALQYLAVEVPRWHRENHCYSCHNNGDAARALYTAVRLGHKVPPEVLTDTTDWLRASEKWDHNNRADPSISDKKLARIQFAAALAAATEAGVVSDKRALVSAARSLLGLQSSEGSWQIDDEAGVGSPVTYGAALATALSLRTLQLAAIDATAVEHAEHWLTRADPASSLDVSAILIGLEKRRSELIPRLLKAQNADGGWGPQPNTPSEAFDTAVALLALRPLSQAEAVQRGRRFLASTQLPSGGWNETTRPAGSQSYAQHVSTSGWATLALLLTEPRQSDQ